MRFFVAWRGCGESVRRDRQSDRDLGAAVEMVRGDRLAAMSAGDGLGDREA
jgi:hypothetical protein